MYLDKSDIINIEECKAIENCIICTICSGVVIDPLQCRSCENVFCRSCIEEWKKKSNTCPYKCQDFTLKENKIFNSIIANLKFKCSNGCDEAIPYLELSEHYQNKCAKLDYYPKYKALLDEYKKLKEEYEKLGTKTISVKDEKFPKILNSQILLPIHSHPLMKCETKRGGWNCDICSSTNRGTIKSYYCSICDYDVCENCKKMQLSEKLFQSVIDPPHRSDRKKCGHQ